MKLSDGRTVIEVLVELVRQSFKFSGRSRRTDGWLWLGAEFLLGLSCAFVFWKAPVEQYITDAIYVVFMVPMIGWTVRRVHDCNLSGLWALPVFFGYFWSFFVWPMEPWMLIVFTILTILPLLVTPDHGPNRFGSDPRSKSFAEPRRN
ncbi:DUF805 domain-containing protein [Aurantiacibacter zhengii]|uniref:DUF805 domain-containing protein n=1 Tax=Aurantiacibacter zhengii TaxID=2307003 RepID=A0A418NX25_9SPHN|nr:DUF805 domain-containing protein [Aurantiacibacter zhengii]